MPSMSFDYEEKTNSYCFLFCFLDILLAFTLDQVAAYDTKQKKMDFFDPSRKDDFLFISGTKVSFHNCWEDVNFSTEFVAKPKQIMPFSDAHSCQEPRESPRWFYVPGWLESPR